MSPAGCPARCPECRVCVLPLQARKVRFANAAQVYDAKAKARKATR